MNISTAIVAVAGLVAVVVVVWLGGPWALLGLGLISVAGAAIYGRASAAAPAPSRRRKRRRKRAGASGAGNGGNGGAPSA